MVGGFRKGLRGIPRKPGMKRTLRWLTVWTTLFAAGGAAARERGDRLVVFVSIQPQAYFVERIGGDRVESQVLVPPGQSPATYAVSAAQMARLSRAGVLFRIGVPFEKTLMPKLSGSMKALRIVDTREGIRLRRMQAAHKHGEAHGHGLAAPGNDPHIWLSPRLAVRQGETVCRTLCELDPGGADAYRGNLAAFKADLEALHERLVAVLAPYRGKTFMVFHPAWGYFADEYGLRQEPIEIEGKEPSARRLARVIGEARAEGVRVIFVQRQFSRKAAKAVATAIGGAVVAIDPLARDYIRNMESIADQIGAALMPMQ